MSGSLVGRLRRVAPHTESREDGDLMREAAAEIERLRGAVSKAWDEGHHAGVWNATDDSGEPFKDNPYPAPKEAS